MSCLLVKKHPSFKCEIPCKRHLESRSGWLLVRMSVRATLIMKNSRVTLRMDMGFLIWCIQWPFTKAWNARTIPVGFARTFDGSSRGLIPAALRLPSRLEACLNNSFDAQTWRPNLTTGSSNPREPRHITIENWPSPRQLV